MSDETHAQLKGCLVLVTADGEQFHRTRIADVTPSGRYVRLENDEPTPGRLERWRARDSIQILEAFASPHAPPVMHGILRLNNPVTRRQPCALRPLPPVSDAVDCNIVSFPLSAIARPAPGAPTTAAAISNR